jgi:hypothetical protein
MDRIFWGPGETGSGTLDLLFDWRPDLARLERAANEALAQNHPDPWTLAEAECWLDLIDAELVAVNNARADPRMARSRDQLQRWRDRVTMTIDRLKAAAAVWGSGNFCLQKRLVSACAQRHEPEAEAA